MAERKARHRTWTMTKVETLTASTLSLTLAELAQFVADAKAAGIPDGSSISVGGVSVHTESYGQKDCWATRISARASQAEIDRAATTSEEAER